MARDKKFKDALDEELYLVMLDRGVEREAGSSYQDFWAGSLTNGDAIAEQIERNIEYGETSDVTPKDIAFLRKHGKAGVILTEHQQTGQVEVSFYSTGGALEQDWADLVRTLGDETTTGGAARAAEPGFAWKGGEVRLRRGKVVIPLTEPPVLLTAEFARSLADAIRAAAAAAERKG